MSRAQVQWCDGRVRVSGSLDFDSVPGLVDIPWGESAPPRIEVELGAVRRVDSAGLALLLEWARAARRQGRAIHFRHTPEQLKSLARVTGVDAILSLD